MYAGGSGARSCGHLGHQLVQEAVLPAAPGRRRRNSTWLRTAARRSAQPQFVRVPQGCRHGRDCEQPAAAAQAGAVSRGCETGLVWYNTITRSGAPIRRGCDWRMDEKTKLLEQLRIDRSESPRSAPESRRSVPIWVVYGLLLLIVAGIGAWFFLRPHAPETPAAASSASDPSGSAASADSSVTAGPVGSTALDASGYVVAQRQATVSAKAIGRVVDLRIEDGQHVKDNEIIARLDDTNTRAALLAAQASLAQVAGQPRGRQGRLRRPGTDFRPQPETARGRRHQCAGLRRRSCELQRRAVRPQRQAADGGSRARQRRSGAAQRG